MERGYHKEHTCSCTCYCNCAGNESYCNPLTMKQALRGIGTNIEDVDFDEGEMMNLKSNGTYEMKCVYHWT